jgi:D-beta-D-heptose 7-phosphate kinase/D-beta-D-heptose 1-phosphate adenosyltransferase
MMLERTISGAAYRLAPDAPIPVILLDEMSEVPGGAANVAHNLAGLACPVVALGFVGDDDEGRRLRRLLESSAVDQDLATLSHWPTITKTRVRCAGDLVVRLDREQVLAGRPLDRHDLQRRLSRRLGDGVGALVVSDYAKGTLDGRTCAEAIRMARSAGVPVFVDPSGHDWTRYRGATGLFPNVFELAKVVGAAPTDTATLLGAAHRMLGELELEFVLLKRDRDGVILVTKTDRWTLPATAKSVRDVSGAGDTVIATVSYGVHARLSLRESVWLANFAAGIVVAELGTTPVNVTTLRKAIAASETAFGAGIEVRGHVACEPDNFSP